MFIPRKQFSRPRGSAPIFILLALILIIAATSYQVFHSQNPQRITSKQEYPPAKQESPRPVNTTSLYERIRILKVIDGDTVELENGEKVRLIGIDTPESQNNPKARRDEERSGVDMDTILALGKKAKDFLSKLSLNREARVEFDTGKFDKYGRLLGYVYLLPEKEGVGEIFINARIIESGYAVPLTIPPNVRHAEEFHELYLQARERKRGLWADEAVARHYR